LVSDAEAMRETLNEFYDSINDLDKRFAMFKILLEEDNKKSGDEGSSGPS